MTSHTYKKTPQADLSLNVYAPDEPADTPRPAVVFFHGGGWNHGTPEQFAPYCQHLAKLGVVGISVQYRLKDNHGTTPFEAIRDAVSAMRWVYQHVEALNLDPQRVAAGGGSAGGHLAALTATLQNPDLEDPADNQDTAYRPAALILFNPVYDNGPGGYGQDRLGDRWQDASPRHNLHADMPPTLVMLGDQDHLIPVATAQAFRDQMQSLGVHSDLIVYPGQSHGFYLPDRSEAAHQQTLRDIDHFLRRLGWIDPAAAD